MKRHSSYSVEDIMRRMEIPGSTVFPVTVPTPTHVTHENPDPLEVDRGAFTWPAPRESWVY